MIVVFGSINLDLIVSVPALPAPGETVLGTGFRSEPGGKGANQAVAAARAGARVAFAGAVGHDAFAEPATALLRAAGADLTRLAAVEQPTGVATISVDPEGGNQIAVAPGANLAARASQLTEADLGPGTTLVLQMEVDAGQTASLIARARASGARIILSLAPPAPLPADALAALDLLLLNESESAALAAMLGSGADPASLRARLGGPDVIVTRGEEGAEAATESGSIRQPAFAVTAIDTTAAGDTFAGVLAAALDAGAGLAEAMRRGAAAAALACTRAGSQGSIPSRAETDALLADGAAPLAAR
ncbi:PfkB family carbohydrate kinase [Elioraea sp.]|uniref:PfkB family carbohydrate kinase n=1 Tax=Elioraea sp. TaxID=2185103 RepID=UPI0025C31D70|nr:PfkB family carbohydrate kinase [Elioraea sp.]